eukprot:COSAG01_NODE_4916_length_4629_cov_1.893157_6_plen_84_part_00
MARVRDCSVDTAAASSIAVAWAPCAIVARAPPHRQRWQIPEEDCHTSRDAGGWHVQLIFAASLLVALDHRRPCIARPIISRRV